MYLSYLNRFDSGMVVYIIERIVLICLRTPLCKALILGETPHIMSGLGFVKRVSAVVSVHNVEHSECIHHISRSHFLRPHKAPDIRDMSGCV